jgi:iron complex transport system substrate-binding protein
MFRRIVLLMLMIAAVMVNAGCGAGNTADVGNGKPAQSSAQSTYPLTVTDDSGAEVTVQKKPERIVSIVPSTTEIAFALGLGDKIVGVSDHDDYPAEAKSKEKIGGFEVNTEKLLSLKPDLVLAAADMTGKTVESLRKLGLTVIAVEPKSIEEIYGSIELIGKATDTGAKAKEVIARMKQEQEQVRTALQHLKPEDKPKVWIELDDTLYTAGKGTILDQLIQQAGGINIAGEVEGWPQFSAEKVIQANPDVILVNYSYVQDPISKVKSRAGWQTINAVKENRIYQTDEDVVSRPSPRMTQGLLQIAKLLHPENF